jgi:hypothetical protein
MIHEELEKYLTTEEHEVEQRMLQVHHHLHGAAERPVWWVPTRSCAGSDGRARGG